MTTLHTDAVEKIPDRMVNMAGGLVSETRFLNNIYSFVDVGIRIRRKEVRGEDGHFRTIRSIEEVGFFSRAQGKNTCTLLVEEGEPTGLALPAEIAAAFKRAGIAGYDAEGNAQVCEECIEENAEAAPVETDDSAEEDLVFAADRIAVNTIEQGANDEAAQQQRMDEIIEELIRLNKNGRTCLGRTSFVG